MRSARLRPVRLVLIVTLIALTLPYLGPRPQGERATADAGGAADGAAALTSAIRSLQKGASEVIAPGSPQGNLGTFYQYYPSGVPAHARYTVIAGLYVWGEFSTLVESDLPLSAERSVYLQGRLYGSTCEHGAELSSERFFAEG